MSEYRFLFEHTDITSRLLLNYCSIKKNSKSIAPSDPLFYNMYSGKLKHAQVSCCQCVDLNILRSFLNKQVDVIILSDCGKKYFGMISFIVNSNCQNCNRLLR